MIPESVEKKIGDKIFKSKDSDEFKKVVAPEEKLQKLLSQIKAFNGSKITVHISAKKEMNAYVTIGGHLYGLVPVAQSEKLRSRINILFETTGLIMNFTIDHRSDFSWLTVAVPKDKTLFVEASAMASMSTNIQMKTKFKGGLRRFISGESLFLSKFKANGMDGEVTIAPGPFGDISHFELKNETVFLSSSSYVAHTEGVVYETKF